jgi:hypothetical protein
VTRTLDGPLGERIDAAHAPDAGTVAVEIDNELIMLDEADAVTLALRVAAAVGSDSRKGDD